MKKKIMLFLMSAVIAVSLTGCKSGDYKEAVKLQEAGDYQAALELYKNIEDYENYKDTAERVDVCKAMIEAISAFDSAKSSAEQRTSNWILLFPKQKPLFQRVSQFWMKR